MSGSGTLLDRAWLIAIAAHEGQVDKSGRRYLDHVVRVVNAVEGEDAKVVAALHDVLEDSVAWPPGRMIDEGIPERLVREVLVLTREFGQPYAEHIDLIALRPLARTVKLADLRDHLDPERIGAITSTHITRYRLAVLKLETAVRAESGA